MFKKRASPQYGSHAWRRAIIGLLILLMAGAAWGRIFWRQAPGMGGSVFESTPEWQRLYQAPVRINGSRGDLAIMGCAQPLAQVMAQLHKAFEAYDPQINLSPAADAGWCLIRTPESALRILALSPAAEGQTLLFMLTQAWSDVRRAAQAPARDPQASWPVYAGSRPHIYVENESAAIRLEIASAAERPARIGAFFESALAQAGYQRLLGSASAQPPSDTHWVVFQKGPELCCLLIQAAATEPESTITLLHKRLQMK